MHGSAAGIATPKQPKNSGIQGFNKDSLRFLSVRFHKLVVTRTFSFVEKNNAPHGARTFRSRRRCRQHRGLRAKRWPHCSPTQGGPLLAKGFRAEASRARAALKQSALQPAHPLHGPTGEPGVCVGGGGGV